MTTQKAANKVYNEYVEDFGSAYADIPKAVMGAVAMSYFINSDGNWPSPLAGFVNEWNLLYQQGIVPQKPPAKFLALLPIDESAGW